MVVSARAKARHEVVEEPTTDGGLNDNTPGVHPGHEMSDLRDAKRQPAAEAVLHYARFSLIDSFPQDPRSAASGKADAPLVDECAEKSAADSSSSKRGVAAVCFGSFLFHALLVTALALGFVATPPQTPIEEAGETVSVIILGDAEADQAAEGEKQDDPQPEEVVAESVQPETVQAAAVPTDAPVEAETVAPTLEVTRVSPENVTAAEPEILVSQSPAETAVVQPMATEVPAEIPPEVSPVAQATPDEVTPVQPTATAAIEPEPDDVPKPDPKPVAQKPVEKPKPEKKQPPKAKVAAGSNGENKQDTKRGSLAGDDVAASDQDSRSAAGRSGVGSAAVANYPGKVASRIRRAIRVPSEYKRMGTSMSVRVKLTINSTGGLGGLSVLRSSGFPELDQAVVDGVRHAAPFPPLPPEWGKSSWTFTQELQVTAGR
ncbi:TonB family protein [Rhizobium sp. S96]|uniref:energy transducer TonB family protein n=1 Tax=Rhizobium sp. S96 TaxID=3055140 RepID=UPI0025AAB79E|nr:TonB family protein [Rhizobium sp. S96]MDM9622595.1 TonB family protein [Rhizobium sp. S96]